DLASSSPTLLRSASQTKGANSSSEILSTHSARTDSSELSNSVAKQAKQMGMSSSRLQTIFRNAFHASLFPKTATYMRSSISDSIGRFIAFARTNSAASPPTSNSRSSSQHVSPANVVQRRAHASALLHFSRRSLRSPSATGN